MVLERIVNTKRNFVENLPEPTPGEHLTQKHSYNFFEALQTSGLNVIAELKSQSPSEGVIKKNYDPVAIAQEYVKGGASCISVLTDETFFGGSFADLAKVRQAVKVPLLCKDFIIDERQVYAAKQNGADAVLLIVRILEALELKKLKTLIESLNMLPVIEVFDEEDLKIALELNPLIVLVNNRNLDSLKLDMNNTANLLNAIPQHIKIIAASGLQLPEDVKNYDSRIENILVGTMLMRSDDPAACIQELKQCRA